LAGEVEPPGAIAVRGLRPDGVADGQEISERVVLGSDMVENELGFLFITEMVESPRFEVLESVVGGRKKREPLRV